MSWDNLALKQFKERFKNVHNFKEASITSDEELEVQVIDTIRRLQKEGVHPITNMGILRNVDSSYRGRLRRRGKLAGVLRNLDQAEVIGKDDVYGWMIN